MFSFFTRKKRKGGLSIIFGETVVYKQEYVSTLPGSKPITGNKSQTFRSRFVSNSRRSEFAHLEEEHSVCSPKIEIEQSEVPQKILDTLAPSPDISQVTFSVNKFKQAKVQHLQVPAKLLDTLSPSSSTAKVKKVVRKRTPKPSREDLPMPKLASTPLKKKVRFADEVIIHRVSIHKFSPVPYSETYKLIITLQCIWDILDEDEDGYLNLEELSYFANKVWEDEDIQEMFRFYSKNPEKGLDFDDWCNLLKSEDPDLSQLVDDLYLLFVDGSSESEEDEDEKSVG